MKLKIESYLSSGGVRILTTTCPNGEECKVGSMTCGRCGYHLRIEKGHVYCRFGRKKKEATNLYEKNY